MHDVFVSSTIVDLGPYRQVVKDLVLEMGWRPVMINEQKLITGGLQVPECIARVQACALFILLCGSRCGWLPTVHQGGDGVTPITQIETHAWLTMCDQEGAYPPLVFMTRGNDNDCGAGEGNDAKAAQTLFRTRLRNGLALHDFVFIPKDKEGHDAALAEFASLVRAQLAEIKRIDAEQRVAAAEAYAQRLQHHIATTKNDWVGPALLALGVGAIWGASSAKPY